MNRKQSLEENFKRVGTNDYDCEGHPGKDSKRVNITMVPETIRYQKSLQANNNCNYAAAAAETAGAKLLQRNIRESKQLRETDTCDRKSKKTKKRKAKNGKSNKNESKQGSNEEGSNEGRSTGNLTRLYCTLQGVERADG